MATIDLTGMAIQGTRQVIIHAISVAPIRSGKSVARQREPAAICFIASSFWREPQAASG
jgi:hypothetical protein